jgi:hypothetical protein
MTIEPLLKFHNEMDISPSRCSFIQVTARALSRSSTIKGSAMGGQFSRLASIRQIPRFRDRLRHRLVPLRAVYFAEGPVAPQGGRSVARSEEILEKAQR